ncbi:DUF6191 domain-containing protein [Streptomyces tritici]|uniref:DUF6191 domain-containing protein n=1 Tax=Streptomyces tritici TaxID=2054410 RepID=UPI003AF03325
MFGGLDELFAPGRRHQEEERRRLALTRDSPGDTDPARGPVDLASGHVTIRVPRTAEAGPAPDGETAEEGGSPDGETAEEGGGAHG